VPEPSASDIRIDFTSGLALAGLGVTRPLLTVRSTDEGIVVTPRWRALAILGAPGFEIPWTEVRSIYRLVGPLGRTHGLRMALRNRGGITDRRGLARVFGVLAKRPVLGLAATDVDAFLASAPATIPRRERSALLWWL